MIFFFLIILVKFAKCINEIPIMKNVLIATSQWQGSDKDIIKGGDDDKDNDTS